MTTSVKQIGERWMRDGLDRKIVIALLILFINLVLVGSGRAATISSCTNITTSDIYVLQNDINDDGNSTCINITVSNVVFDGAGYTIDGQDGVFTYGVLVNSTTALTNITVKDLNVTDWTYGIYYYNVTNGSIENNNASSNAYGIWHDSSSNNTITNNNAMNNSFGIYLSSSSNNTLTNNTANSNSNTGIRLSSSSNNNTLIGNNASSQTYDAGTEYGIYLSSSDGNTLKDNTANNNPDYGIYLSSSSNSNTLTNNTANFNTQDGIYLSSSSNNTLADNIANFNSQYGILISSSSNSNALTNNTAYNNTNNGIYLSSSDNNTIANNNASSNSIHGISLTSSSNNTLADNIANSNTFDGIYLQSSSNNTIANNNASSNSYAGIYLSSSSNNTLTNNNATNNSFGIYLTSSSNNNTLTNNNANSNSNTGIRLASSSNSNTLTNNTMSSNNWDFYSTTSPSNTIITNLFNDTRASFTYSGNMRVNSSSSPAGDPSGYTNIGKYLNIINTPVAWVYLNISYSDAEVAGVNESSLRMWKHNGSNWSQVPSPNGVDTASNHVYTNITSFSVFAPLATIGADTTPPTITIISPVNGTTYTTSSVALTFTVDEATNWTGYSLNGGVNVTSGNTTLNLANGVYNLTVYANDTAGNMNWSTLGFTVNYIPPAPPSGDGGRYRDLRIEDIDAPPLEAGGTANISVTVRNYGTYDESNAKLTILDLPVGWTAEEVFTGYIGRGDSVTKELGITLPEDAPEGNISLKVKLTPSDYWLTSERSFTLMVTTIPPPVIQICGDINGDNEVTSADTLLALQMSVGKVPMNLTADVNGDGEVTSLDARLMLQASVGLVEFIGTPEEPCGEIAMHVPLPEVPEVRRGDVDRDGDVDSADALLALQMSVGKVEWDLIADVSEDGRVTSLDARLILQASVGQIEL